MLEVIGIIDEAGQRTLDDIVFGSSSGTQRGPVR